MLYLCLVSCNHFLEERGRGVSGFLVTFCLVSTVGLSEPLTHRLLSILWPIMDLISVTFWHVIFHAPNGNNFLNMNRSIIRVFLPLQISKVCNPILVYSVMEMHSIQWHIPINILLRSAPVKSDSILNLARVLILTKVRFLNHHTLAVS